MAPLNRKKHSNGAMQRSLRTARSEPIKSSSQRALFQHNASQQRLK